MKNLVLSLFVSLFTLLSFSQTPVNVYVVNPNGCPYSLTNTWSSPVGAGNATITSVDSLMNQELWHLEVQDSTNQAMLSVCVVPAPPCNCPMECMGPISTFPNMAITLILCNTINVDELEVLTIQNPIKKIEVLFLQNLLYLIFLGKRAIINHISRRLLNYFSLLKNS